MELIPNYTFKKYNYEFLLFTNSYKEVTMHVIKSPKDTLKVSATILQDVINSVFEELPEDKCLIIKYRSYVFRRGESPIQIYQTLLNGLTF